MFQLSVSKVLLTVVAMSVTSSLAAADTAFHSAQPVWPTDRETEMNLTVGYRGAFTARSEQETVLKIACSTVYRAFLSQLCCRWPES